MQPCNKGNAWTSHLHSTMAIIAEVSCCKKRADHVFKTKIINIEKWNYHRGLHPHSMYSYNRESSFQPSTSPAFQLTQVVSRKYSHFNQGDPNHILLVPDHISPCSQHSFLNNPSHPSHLIPFPNILAVGNPAAKSASSTREVSRRASWHKTWLMSHGPIASKIGQ